MTEATAGTAANHRFAAIGGAGRRALVLAALVAAFVVACLAWGSPASAAPASETVVPLKQPGGETFDARQYGDEWNHGYETREGYTVVREPERKEWEYATLEGGDLEPSGRVAGEEAPPDGVEEHLRADDAEVPKVSYPEPEQEMLPSSVEKFAGDEGMGALASVGEHKSLVILAQFTDQASMGTTPAQWSSRFFGASDSVRDYYQKASYGKLNIGAASESHGTADDGVVGWLDLPYAHPNTANFDNGALDRKTVSDAVKAADAYVNYKAYDTDNNNKLSSKELHVTVIAAGQEGSCCRSYGKAVWGHYWNLFGTEQPTVDGVLFGGSAYGSGYTQFGEYHYNHMATLGIMVHEMGHDLGLPDLYDVDGTSEGVGDWSVMGSGSWNTVSGQYGGAVPPFPDAWSRYYQGWVTPKREIGTKQVGQATTSDAVYQLHENMGGLDWISNVKSGTGEYFLVENRQKAGYDAGLPGCGLLVWHIDETRTSSNSANANDAQRLVDLEEADGRNDLDIRANQGDAGDSFPGFFDIPRFDDLSTPTARLHDGRASGTAMAASGSCSSSMSATFSDAGVPSAPANDAFADAREITLANNSASVGGTNVAATKEAGEPLHANNAGGKSVWYRWTAPSDGKMTLDTLGSTTASGGMLDTTMGVYTGSGVGGLSQVVPGNDDENTQANIFTSEIGPFDVTAGTTYRVAVDGFNDGGSLGIAEGNVVLDAAFAPAPQPDTTAPAVEMTAPAASATVGGASVVLSADATDNVGVSRVEFYVGGQKVGTDTTAGGTNGRSYSVTWNSGLDADGIFGVQARAYDAAGNEGTSGMRTVNVLNAVAAVPPTVLSSVPAPDKEGVSRKSNVKVTFAEVMQRATLNKYNVTLYRQGTSTPVSATVAPSADNRSATLNPYGTTRKMLAARAWYEVVLWREASGGPRAADDGALLGGSGLYKTSADGRYVSFWFKTAG